MKLPPGFPLGLIVAAAALALAHAPEASRIASPCASGGASGAAFASANAGAGQSGGQEPAAPPVSAPKGDEEAAALLAALREAQDDADPALVSKLGAIGSRAALDGLLEAYAFLGTIHMRRVVLEELPAFDRRVGLEQRALQALMDVGTADPERELRMAAVKALGRCERYGPAFLRMIADSPADPEVRIAALQEHVAWGRPEDRSWYRSVWERTAVEPAPEPPARKGKAAPPPAPAPERGAPLARLRRIAFQALKGELSVADLVRGAADPDAEIRVLGLRWLYAADAASGLACAELLYPDRGQPIPVRAAAASVLLSSGGAKAARKLAEDAQRYDLSHALRMAIADLLVGNPDPELERRLAKLVATGQRHEQLFAIRALGNAGGERVDRALVKLLRDKDQEIALAAIEALGTRKSELAGPELEQMLERGRDPELQGEALVSLSALRAGEPGWGARLAQYTASEEPELRNSALAELGRLGGSVPIAPLEGGLSHPSWSTRLAALRALEARRDRAAVGLLVARLGSEDGRMREEIAQALFRLSGRSLGTSAGAWRTWWEQAGPTFHPIDPAELARRTREDDLRRSRELTHVSFFGIRVVSHRVLFVIDVSLSMLEPAQSGGTRLDAAKRELLGALDGLDGRALFNLIVFAGSASSWQPRVIDAGVGSPEAIAAHLASARSYVQGLRTGAGTNLFAALQRAFADPEVDTIYLLTDGEPTMGEVRDPALIRERVRRWNQNRGVVIHTVALGESVPILEWLAEDSGGSWRLVP